MEAHFIHVLDEVQLFVHVPLEFLAYLRVRLLVQDDLIEQFFHLLTLLYVLLAIDAFKAFYKWLQARGDRRLKTLRQPLLPTVLDQLEFARLLENAAVYFTHVPLVSDLRLKRRYLAQLVLLGYLGARHNVHDLLTPDRLRLLTLQASGGQLELGRHGLMVRQQHGRVRH